MSILARSTILKRVMKENRTIMEMTILSRKGKEKGVGVVRMMMMKEKMRIVRSVQIGLRD
jgi:hypothetical protein